MADKMIGLFRLTLSFYDIGLQAKELLNSYKFRKWRKIAKKTRSFLGTKSLINAISVGMDLL